MRSLMIALALVVVLATASTASAGWTYVAPPAVYGYYPVGPVYAYPGAVPVVVARPIVTAPVMAPAPAYYPGAPAVYAYPYAGYPYAAYPYAGYPYAVRARVLVPGQPVRNTLRAAFP